MPSFDINDYSTAHIALKSKTGVYADLATGKHLVEKPLTLTVIEVDSGRTYAVSICAGSSLFLMSTTAVFILSDNIDSAELESNGSKYSWEIKQYFRYGLLNYTVQMIIAVVWIMLVV